MHGDLCRGTGKDAVQVDLLEGRQRAVVKRRGEGGAAGVGDLGVVEVEHLELRQHSSRRRRRHEGGEAPVAERVAKEVEIHQRGPPPQGRRESHQPRVTDGGVGQKEALEPRQGASVQGSGKCRGAMPHLIELPLHDAAICDAGLVALAPALRRRRALEVLYLNDNVFGDEGLAALVAPPPAGALPPPTGGLKKLKKLYLDSTQISDAGCAVLASALDSGALPVLETISLAGISASAAAKKAVHAAVARSSAALPS